MWGHSKIKVGGTAPPSCHFKNGGTSPEEEKKLAAGAEFTKKEGQQGFPREFFVGGGSLFSQGGGAVGGTKIPPQKIAGQLLNKKQKKISCA